MQRDNRKAIDLSHIDDYRVNTPSEHDPISNDEKVEKIIGKDIKTKKLHKNTQVNYRARREFISLLNKVLFNYETDNHSPKETPANDAIELHKLLGASGISAYKAAIDEECASKEFRNALFLKACTHFEGKKWSEQMILWVGGPSASGKSYGANAAVKKLGHDVMMKERRDNLQGNDVVSIDGGIEREVSQMRQLTLQVALKKGYSGIKDLHSYTKIGLKKLIQGVALAAKLSIVIPNTFTGINTTKKIKKLDKINGTVQIFSEVSPADGMDADFKKTVERMGNERAWKLKYGMENAKDLAVKYNDYDIGIESKNYNKEYFERGRSNSINARNEYLQSSKDKIYACIVNDLIYVNKDARGKWVKCEDESEKNCLKISKRDFDVWNKDNHNKLDLPEWLDQHKKEKKLAQPIITIDVRGKRFLQGKILELENEIYELIRDNRTRRSSSGLRNKSDSGSPTKKLSLFKPGRSSRTGSGTFGSVNASPSYNSSSSSPSSSPSSESPLMKRAQPQEGAELKRQNIILEFKPLITEIALSDEPTQKKLEMLDKIEVLLKEVGKIEGNGSNDTKAMIITLESLIERNREKLDSESMEPERNDIESFNNELVNAANSYLSIMELIEVDLMQESYALRSAKEWWDAIQEINGNKKEKIDVMSKLSEYIDLCISTINDKSKRDIAIDLAAEVATVRTQESALPRRGMQSTASMQSTLTANREPKPAPARQNKARPIPPTRSQAPLSSKQALGKPPIVTNTKKSAVTDDDSVAPNLPPLPPRFK